MTLQSFCLLPLHNRSIRERTMNEDEIPALWPRPTQTSSSRPPRPRIFGSGRVAAIPLLGIRATCDEYLPHFSFTPTTFLPVYSRSNKLSLTSNGSSEIATVALITHMRNSQQSWQLHLHPALPATHPELTRHTVAQTIRTYQPFRRTRPLSRGRRLHNGVGRAKLRLLVGVYLAASLTASLLLLHHHLIFATSQLAGYPLL